MRSTGCDTVRRALWSGEGRASFDAHLEACPECRLESARASHLSGALSSLGARLAEPPPHLHASLLASAIPSRVLRARHAAAALGRRAGSALGHPRVRGAAAGAAAAAIVGVVLAKRLQRPSLAT